jgi:NAD+ diphosphatase
MVRTVPPGLAAVHTCRPAPFYRACDEQRDATGGPSMSETFVPLLQPPDSPAVGEALWFHVRGNTVWVTETPSAGDSRLHFVGMLGTTACWAVDVADDAVAPDDAFYVDLYRLYGSLPPVQWHAAGRAVQLVEWGRTHSFCGRCGSPTESASGERAMRCPRCGLLAFPRLAPAVITLVTRGDEALLARGRTFAVPMYSCIAGFVEPGETLEQAVVREVREEVGVDVAGVRYVGSQPWPFPHSLMIGFRAEWAAGDIVIDPSEIADAGWYRRDDLPMIPPGISIARTLIDGWLAGT